MITFGVTVHNEGDYLQTLLNQLVPYCEQSGDEIVIVDDYSTDELTRSLLDVYSNENNIKVYNHHLDNDFAQHKNYLNSQCNGEYIFQLDADEFLHNNLLTYLHDVVENNTQADLFFVPRVNVVTGMTDEDVIRYGWTVNDNGWIVWPDYQTRIYRNTEFIRWHGKVHERIQGYEISAMFPDAEEWAIYHIKTIERQREQNSYYETIQR